MREHQSIFVGVVGEDLDIQALQNLEAHRITPYPEVRTLLPWWDRHLLSPVVPCRAVVEQGENKKKKKEKQCSKTPSYQPENIVMTRDPIQIDCC